MTDEEFAKELVLRFNRLIENADAKRAVAELFGIKVDATGLDDHPAIYVGEEDGRLVVGMIGILNGVVGSAVAKGPLGGFGRVCTMYAEDLFLGLGLTEGFDLTVKP